MFHLPWSDVWWPVPRGGNPYPLTTSGDKEIGVPTTFSLPKKNTLLKNRTSPTTLFIYNDFFRTPNASNCYRLNCHQRFLRAKPYFASNAHQQSNDQLPRCRINGTRLQGSWIEGQNLSNSIEIPGCLHDEAKRNTITRQKRLKSFCEML